MKFKITSAWRYMQAILGLMALVCLVSTARASTASDVLAGHEQGINFCEITSAGGVRCWGGGWLGQLGNAQFLAQTEPVAVLGLQGRARQVVVGGAAACALLDEGQVSCWGGLRANMLQMSTDEQARQQSVASLVVGLPTDVDMLLGTYCARSPSRGRYCWSMDSYPFQAQAAPFSPEWPWLQSATQVLTDESVSNRVCGFSAGLWRCAADSNFYGALSPSLSGVYLSALSSVEVTLPRGPAQSLWLTPDRGCARNAQNELWCWGRAFGRAASGESEQVMPMVQRQGAWDTVVQVVGGDQHQCALDRQGRVWCWGLNTYGQLGVSGMEASDQPVAVQGLPGPVQALASVANGLCARLVQGGLYCWGRMTAPMVGAVPRRIRSEGVVDVSWRDNRLCMLEERGQVLCVGYGVQKTVGDDGWRAVEGLPPVTRLSGSCALDVNGQPWCWDARLVAQAGPALAQAAIGLATSNGAQCVLTAERSVMCWGLNYRGQLGPQAAPYDNPTPIPMVGLRGAVSDLVAGIQHFCATLVDGGVQCWGSDAFDELGDGPTHELPERLGGNPHSAQPVDVVGSSGLVWTGVSASDQNTCAVTQDGRLLCWGRLNGPYAGQSAGVPGWPANAAGSPVNLQQVGAGVNHTCAVDAQGQVWCWGGNDYAELGLGEHRLQRTWTYCVPGPYMYCYGTSDTWASKKTTPVQPLGLDPAMRRVRALGRGACAVSQAGALWCWGMTLPMPDWRLGSSVPRALVAEAVTSAEDRVFNYLQSVAPSILFPANSQTLSHQGYRYRAYDQQTYLGAKDGRLYYAGPLMSDGSLADLGELSFWLTRAQEAGY